MVNKNIIQNLVHVHVQLGYNDLISLLLFTKIFFKNFKIKYIEVCNNSRKNYRLLNEL